MEQQARALNVEGYQGPDLEVQAPRQVEHVCPRPRTPVQCAATFNIRREIYRI